MLIGHVLQHSYRTAMGRRVSMGRTRALASMLLASEPAREAEKGPHFGSSVSHCHVPFLL